MKIPIASDRFLCQAESARVSCPPSRMPVRQTFRKRRRRSSRQRQECAKHIRAQEHQLPNTDLQAEQLPHRLATTAYHSLHHSTEHVASSS